MNSLSPSQIEILPWYALGLYWLVTGFRVKSTKSLEPAPARLFTMSLVAIAFFLLYSHNLKISWLYSRFLPQNSLMVWTGIALTYTGIALAIWARTILGSNWGARVSIKQGHELIRSGPYACVRHPIYTGLFLAILGAVLEIGEWRAIIALAIVAVAHSLKAKREEAAMMREFGEEYQRYRGETGFFFPR